MYIVSCAITKTHNGGIFYVAEAEPILGVGYTSPFSSKKSLFKVGYTSGYYTQILDLNGLFIDHASFFYTIVSLLFWMVAFKKK